MSVHRGESRRRFGLVALLIVSLLASGAAMAQETEQAVLPSGGGADQIQVMIELNDPPAALVYGNALRGAAPGNTPALAAAVTAARAQIDRLAAAQASFDSVLAAAPVATQEIFRVQKAYNGISVLVDADKVDVLRRLPGVKAVHVVPMEYPSNSTSVPFLGTPQLWEDTLGLGVNADGTGVSIGIIDTGIDYQHATFGGSGLLADYQANDRTVTDAFFPNAKVVGGFDFAGDNYAGGATPPAPDPDPMDCNGHGSHVAGTAAGYGVQNDGTPFPGPYTVAAPYGSLRVGPGTAPRAQLYGLRVFGCGGGTGLTVQAVDWAMDPNGDSDLSDHLDVINLSLGASFGNVSNPTSVAVDNAAYAGVVVVTSAGNNGDTFFISGSPGAGSRVIATAASADSGLPGAGVRVNAPGGIAGFYVAGTAAGFGGAPPPGGITGDVVLALDPSDGAGVLTTDGCSPLTNAGAIAGNIALIDRGTCGFAVKALNAQNAGAIAVVIANNAAAFGNLGGVDPTVITPTVMVTLADGNTFKANIPGLNVTLFPASDTMAAFSSRGPRRASSPIRVKPDITAPGVAITSAQTGVTCTGVAPSVGCQVASGTGFLADSQPLVLQGTSMSTPHMAGIMALLRQLHPDWTVEELKALAMNGAHHDITTFPGGGGLRYGPSRVGAGRVDPANSATIDVVAFNADEVGLVSVSFDTEVVGTVTRTKNVRVVNHGSTSQTFDLGIDTVVDAPGVAFSLPGGNTLTVGPGETVEIAVQMDADATLMDHTRDGTLAAGQATIAPGSLAGLGAIVRHWLTEEMGYITFSQGGNLEMRVPVYVAPRPASTMSAPATIVTGGNPTGSTTIPLSGTDVCTGTLGAGPTCTGVFPNDVVSLVSPFELQVVSPLDPFNAPAYADLQYAGVAADATRIYFGVSTWGEWSSPTDTAFNVYVDNNLDGTYDRIIITSNPGALGRIYFGGAGQPDTDTFTTSVVTLPGTFSNLIAAGTPSFVNLVGANVADTAVFNNNVLYFAASPAQLGLASVNSPFRYRIETCPGFAPLCQPLHGFHFDEAVGPFTWNGGARGLDFGAANSGLAFDLNGGSIPVTWNTANLATNGSLGALLLHHHNAAGSRAEVVLLEGTASADLSITKSMNPPSPTIGQNVTFTLTVTNNGPDAATGVVVSDFLPGGLTYVSDDGGGAYDPGLGLWTVGNLAVSASANLQLVATVDTTDAVDNVATITAGSPLDPDPADNEARVTVMAPEAADLALSMGVNVATVNPGGSVIFTLTVTNNGNDPAYAIDVNEAFPLLPALNPTSFVASQGSYNPATGLWDLASLGSGNTATLALTFTAPNMAGALTNNGTAAASTSDPDTANNAASATVTVLSPSVVTNAKTVSGSFLEGGTITYTVVLTNSGAFDQQNNPTDEFVDVLPAQLTLTAASATSGTATPNVGTNTVTWNGSVPAGGSVTITITATINAGTGGQTVSNQGTVNHDPDGNGVSESATPTDDPAAAGAANPTSFLVLSPASVGTRTKTVAGTFNPGTNVTYTVTISNPSAAGQLDNPGDEFTDVLPAQLILVSASATSGTAVATVATNTVTWNGAIAPAGSVTITITATILPSAVGQAISNQGTIRFDADGNGTNEASVLTDDPALPGADDPTTFVSSAVLDIPTLSEVGLMAMALFLAAGALLLLRRRTA
jgi:uncharacterized repeat protein (TIGR01451 family)